MTENASDYGALAEPKFENATAELATEAGATNPNTLLLEDFAHGSANCSAFLRREIAHLPSTHRLDSVLDLVKLRPKGDGST
jgi:hypothetical protein